MTRDRDREKKRYGQKERENENARMQTGWEMKRAEGEGALVYHLT